MQDGPCRNLCWKYAKRKKCVRTRGHFAEQGERGVLCLQAFRESCEKFYQAQLEELSFAEDTEECRRHINDWVTEKTEGERFSPQCTWHFAGKRAEIGGVVASVVLPRLSLPLGAPQPVTFLCVFARFSGQQCNSDSFLGFMRSRSGDC